MKKFLYILVIFFLCTAPISAQRETANWYFGSNAGLDFNNGTPQILLNGELGTTEGCSTVSDNFGNLLFYTDGTKVWDKNHNIMLNGEDLLGSYSSSQSALIVPNIGNPNLYYIFTPDAYQAYSSGGTGNGFNYSVVDISLNGGLGSIIEKNTNLLANCSEKVTSVSAFDGSGYWVVTHAGNKFYAYKVGAAGVNTTPVVTTIGPNIDDFNNIRGCMKISPNGEQLAIAHAIFEPSYDGSLILYDFNTNTGTVSNGIEIATERVFYGVEFSPNSSKLYASGKLVDDSGSLILTTDIVLYQYNLEVSNIDRTEFLMNTYESLIENNLGGTVQLGFDKKVYHAILGDKLSVINEPNLIQRSADYREFNIDIGDRLTRYGLPSYVQSAFESIVDVESLCFNNATQFTIDANDTVQSITWDFGDPASGVDNTSTNLNPTHLFTSTGLFTVTIDVNFLNRTPQRYIEFIEIGEAPSSVTEVTLRQCDIDGVEDGITLFNLTEAEQYFNGGNNDLVVTYFTTIDDAINNENLITENGYENEYENQIVFAKAFVNSDCYSIIEITLSVQPFANLETYSTIYICNENDEDALIIDVVDVINVLSQDFSSSNITIYHTENDALLENSGIIGEVSILNTDPQELYFRIESVNQCNFIGKVVLSAESIPEVEDQTAIFCTDAVNFLDAGNSYIEYLWSTGETTQKIQINQHGLYWVEVFSGINCSSIINFESKLSEEFEVIDIIIDDFKPENSVTVVLDDYDGNIEYSLDGGQTLIDNNTFTNVTPGLHDLMIIKDNCHIKTETVLVGGFPNYFTPNGDGIHDTWKIKVPEFFVSARIKIYDRYGKLLKIMNAFDGWDGKHEGQLMLPADYWFSITLDNKVVFGHFALTL